MAQSENIDAAALQHEIIGAAAESNNNSFSRNKHPGAQWFNNPGMGLFIHFGISTVHGNIDISWGMMAGKPWDNPPEGEHKITPEEYFRLAESFNPENYNPDEWLKLASEAGFQYAVLTTKHHDGYALWPSEYGEFSTRTYMNGRDLVQLFVEACRKYNLKVGLYYSPPDWYYNRQYMSFHYGSAPESGLTRFPDRKTYGLKHEVIDLLLKPKGWDDHFKDYVKGQIIELLTRYGKIDILWFDGGLEVKDAISIDEIREIQPWILVNSRMHGYGDFLTPECRKVESRPGEWWELCQIWAEGSGWAYMKCLTGYRPSSWFLSLLSRTLTWYGHLLINVGPQADGTLPESAVERLKEVAEWMKHSGSAMINVEGGPYPEKCNVPVTRRGTTWYLHLIPGFKETVRLQEVEPPMEIKLLRTGQKLDFIYENRMLYIQVPESMRTEQVDIIEVCQ